MTPHAVQGDHDCWVRGGSAWPGPSPWGAASKCFNVLEGRDGGGQVAVVEGRAASRSLVVVCGGLRHQELAQGIYREESYGWASLGSAEPEP